MSSQSKPYVKITPGELLVFNLVRGESARAIVKVENISDQKVIFKVKTRKPEWWGVSPVQHILDIGESQDVQIALGIKESNMFLDKLPEGDSDFVDMKYKLFLVQSTMISDNTFTRFTDLPIEKRGEEYTKLWSQCPKESINLMKIKVDFLYSTTNGISSDINGNDSNNKSIKPGVSTPMSAATMAGTQTDLQNSFVSVQDDPLGKKIEDFRDKVATNHLESNYGMHQDSPSVRDGTSNNTNTTENDEMSQQSQSHTELMHELHVLRKKFDSILEYTCHLTMERDSLVSQIKEMKRNASLNASQEAASASQRDDTKDKKQEEYGFSGFTLLFVFVVALAAFVIGRMLRLSETL